MASKSPDPDERQGGDPGMRDRIVWLLENLWQGSQRGMARDLGISQASLSRIARQVQEPGRRLVSAIAAHPRVNDTWLYTGRGEPLLTEPVAEPGTGYFLPVVHQVLPGKPAGYIHRLSGMAFPVARQHYRDTRYFLQLSSRVGLAPNEEMLVADEDLLLMEADESVWEGDEGVLLGRFCGARVEFPDGVRCVLGTVGLGPVFHPLEKNDYLLPGPGPGAATVGPALSIAPAGLHGPWPLSAKAVVAVGIQLIRTWGALGP